MKPFISCIGEHHERTAECSSYVPTYFGKLIYRVIFVDYHHCLVVYTVAVIQGEADTYHPDMETAHREAVCPGSTVLKIVADD